MKVNRLVSIIMILLDKKRISAQELATMFEVSPRTIYRDIEAINMAGIPIRSTSGVGGGFEIMEKYKLDHKVFSTEDLSALLMGLASLSNMTEGNEVRNAFAKVKSFIPTDTAKEIEIKANQIHIDLSPWLNNRNIQPYLEIIKTALQENRILSFDYADRYGNKTTRIVEPYQLILKNSHWYFQSYCYEREDFRLFKLSRISNLVLKEGFTPREHQKPQMDISDRVAAMQIQIKIRVHQSVMDQVLDYCPYEDFITDGKEHYIVDFPFIENDYYYNILFSLGHHCECLEPKYIRSEMKSRAQKIADLYES